MDTTVAVALIAGSAGLLGAGTGALAATFGPVLVRRYERKVAEETERRNQLRQSITRLHVLLDEWVYAWRSGDAAEQERLHDAIRVENVTFRLWINGEDRALAGLIYRVLSAKNFRDSVTFSHAWHDVALEWFRGATKGRDAEAEFEEYVRVGREIAAKVDEENAAAAAEAKSKKRRARKPKTERSSS